MVEHLKTEGEIKDWIGRAHQLGARHFELWERSGLPAPVQKHRLFVSGSEQAWQAATLFLDHAERVSGQAVTAVFGYGMQPNTPAVAMAFVVSVFSEIVACRPNVGTIVIGSLVSCWLPNLGTIISNLEADKSKRAHQELKQLRVLWQLEWSRA